MNHHETSRLYESIQQSDWKSASRALRLYPEEASSWVVLLHPPPDERDHEGGTPTTTPTTTMTQRFLPLHSALARNPPPTFVRALMEAYPAGVREKDGTGMLPLHYACGNRCGLEILQLLLSSSSSSSSSSGEKEGGVGVGVLGYEEAVWEEDVNGMTPLHYVASWGPSELGVVELLMRAAESTSGGGQRTVREWILQQDVRGMTPLALAREAEYDGREEVVALLERWLNGSNMRGDHRVGLQVITTATTSAAAPSPTARRSSHVMTKSERDSPFSRFESESHHRDRQGNGRYSSRHVPREGTDAMMISTVHEKEKHVHHSLTSPRSNSSGSGNGRRPSQEYPIHLIDDRRSPSDDSRSGSAMRRHASATSRDSLDDNDNNDNDDENAPQRTRRERYSSNSPLHPISSTTPSIRTETSPMTPTIMNMKTPRSSGRGARFGFDLSSPRYYTASPPTAGGLLSPRAQPSPRGQLGTPLHSQPQNLEVVTSELQRLQLENETLRKECSQKDLENQELCARLSHYEQGERRRVGGGDGLTSSSPEIHHTSIIRHLNAVLHSLLDREKALTEAVNAMQQRESIRRNRTQTMMKLLVEEEEEEQERNSLERIFGKEIRCLEEVRDEVGRMLEGLGE